HDIQLSLVVDYFQWLASCFGSSWSNGPPCCKYYTYQYKLVIVVAIVGVGVTVVVVAAEVVVVVESSSVVKLSFVVT
ncbi:hypothetical protein Tco_1457294, partial [Tanacetum coccineum]